MIFPVWGKTKVQEQKIPGFFLFVYFFFAGTPGWGGAACSGGLPSRADPGNLAHGQALSRTLPYGKIPGDFFNRQHVNPEKQAKSVQGLAELEAWVLPMKKKQRILLTGNRPIWG